MVFHRTARSDTRRNSRKLTQDRTTESKGHVREERLVTATVLNSNRNYRIGGTVVINDTDVKIQLKEITQEKEYL